MGSSENDARRDAQEVPNKNTPQADLGRSKRQGCVRNPLTMPMVGRYRVGCTLLALCWHCYQRSSVLANDSPSDGERLVV